MGVVVPGGTSGADLGRAPDLPVLYTSGDSGDTLFRHAQLSAPAAAGKEETVSVGRLLVVDDDPGFGELVRKVGLKLDFEVEVASNGKEFTRAYDSFDPTVVVLDMVMPDVEGIELIQWLGDRGADLHLIVVTGYTPRYATLAKKLAEAKGLRSVAALSKPVRLSELQASLNRTVEA